MPTLTKFFGWVPAPAAPLGGGAGTNITFTAADNQNNTGATATILGSDLTSTNTIFVVGVGQIFNGQTVAWRSVAQRTGDGQVNIPLAYGTYWGFVEGQVGGLATNSAPAIFAVTVNKLAVYTRILNDVQARVQSMSLATISSQNVYQGMFPSDRTSVFPCIWVTKEGLRETFLGGTNVRDDLGHPVHLVFVDRNPQVYNVPSPTYDKWREQLRRAFERQRLPNVPEVYDCVIEPELIIDPRLPHYKYLVSGLVLRFKSREPRGTS